MQQTKEIIVGGTIAGGTLASGVGTILQWLPPVLGCIATIVGIISSVFFMFKMHNDIKTSIENRKYTKSLRKEIAERKKHGLPLARHADQEILDGEKKEKR